MSLKLCCVPLSLIFMASTVLAQNGNEPLTPAKAESRVLISAENSRVEFVGTHVGDDPKPRLGGFKDFRGFVTVDPTGGKLKSLELTFAIGSLWTEFDDLTKHLLNADFFDQAQFPEAVFRSTQIASLGSGRCNIKGELTMHGKTSKVAFPANFELNDQGLTLTSQFILDRTEFGMDKGIDGVEKGVSINFSIGIPDKNFLSKEEVANPQPKAVPMRNCFAVHSQNSSVEFVGTHVGDDPKPRLGGFSKFNGLILMDEKGAAPESMSIDFEIGSIWTEFDKLTGHLMAPDFFDQRKYPKATFHSTQIVTNGAGQYTVKGELAMLGKSAELSFPAKVTIGNDGLTLSSEFILDRTNYGMNKMTDGVEKEVAISFVVGKPDRQTKKKSEEAAKEQTAKMKNAATVKIKLPKMLQY